MSTFRFSVSLPDDNHSDIEVSVEQIGEPSVGFSVSIPDGTGAKTTVGGPRPRVSGKAAPTVNDDYCLGGYAGI